MDAYELPEEFAHLQAQDMAKIGFINDIVRGIKKVIKKDDPKPTVVKETVVASPEEKAKFARFMASYKNGLAVEKKATEVL